MYDNQVSVCIKSYKIFDVYCCQLTGFLWELSNECKSSFLSGSAMLGS